jgi:hypothetical protein
MSLRSSWRDSFMSMYGSFQAALLPFKRGDFWRSCLIVCKAVGASVITASGWFAVRASYCL